MTEQKPYAWAYELSATGIGPWTGGVCIHEPVVGQHIRRVEPLFRHPPAPTDAKPVAWLYESCARDPKWQLHVHRKEPPAAPFRRNIRAVYEHPPAPAAPVTTPEVEAARRKALKVILTYLEREKYTSDLYGVRLALGVLRDLTGQSRRFPETRIGDYDEPLCADVCREATPDHVPEKGPERPVPLPARLSVDYLASVVANNGATRVEITNVWVKRIAAAVHEAVYGKDA